ncbi:MAG: zinc-binding dehydrogenase [Armatimonadaceae bacterium]
MNSMKNTMKILQVTAPGEFVVHEIEKPRPEAGQVLLRINAVTTCPQWDLHLNHNDPMYPGHQFQYPYAPGQPGHEATGIIEEVGEGVTDLKPGDRVSAWRDTGHHRNGCYAQYVVHRAENVIRVPEGLSDEALAPVELAMCVGTVFRTLREMNVLHGKRVAVNGLGPAGLIAMQMAKAEGAQEVIGFDFVESRRERAQSVGADRCFDPRNDLSELFPVRPAKPQIDTAVDCVGAKTAVEYLMDRTADTVALFGVQRETYEFAPRHYSLRLCGYKGHFRESAEYAVELIRDGKLDLSALVTHKLPLERYGEAVQLLEKQEAVKVCFLPWAE